MEYKGNNKYRTCFIVCIIVYVVAVAAYVSWSNRDAERALYREIDRKLLLAARGLKFMLAPDFHDRALKEDSISREEELRNRAAISGFALDTEFKYVYTLTERDGRFYFSAPTVTEEEAREREVWYFYPYDDVPEEFVRAFREKVVVYSTYEDQWGRFRSVALPQESPGGRTYLSCADYEISYVQGILRRSLLRSILTAGFFLFISFPFVLIYRRTWSSYTGDLKALNRELSDHQSHLTELIEERTGELSRSNKKLQEEVTERKRSEKAFQESEKKYRDLFNDVSDFLYFHDINGRFIDTNLVLKEYGYSDEDMKGLDARKLLSPKNRENFDLYIERLKERGRDQGLMVILTKEGEERTLEYKSALVRGLGGEPVGVRGSARDITERILADRDKKKLKAQLVHAQRMEAIGTLAGGIAHNFNNLLMGIQGNATLARLKIPSEDPIYERLETIEKIVKNGSKLTGQLLGYAREGRYEVRTVDLNMLVGETANTFSEAKKDIVIHLDLAEDHAGIEADKSQIEQILLNLYVNAADAMPHGGDLFIETSEVTHEDMKGRSYSPRPGDYILLKVRDTGIGMDKKTLGRIFEPFFTLKGVGKGTGLGLSSVYGIVKGHGGYIDVQSAPGKGTTFEIHFPLSGKTPAVKKGRQTDFPKGTETVLFVDDESTVIDVGKELLTLLGYKVLTAGTGKEAVSLYERDHDSIDIVILDMIMPEVGGGQVYDSLKTINPGVKALLSSGYSVEGQATEILERGCNGFIQKPFRLMDLAHKLRDILDQKDPRDLHDTPSRPQSPAWDAPKVSAARA